MRGGGGAGAGRRGGRDGALAAAAEQAPLLVFFVNRGGVLDDLVFGLAAGEERHGGWVRYCFKWEVSL